MNVYKYNQVTNSLFGPQHTSHKRKETTAKKEMRVYGYAKLRQKVISIAETKITRSQRMNDKETNPSVVQCTQNIINSCVRKNGIVKRKWV